MLSAVTTMQLLGKNLDRRKETFAETPSEKREIEYFLRNIGKVRTSSDFVKDYRLFSFAMKSFNLDELTYAKAFMRRVMDGGLKDPDSAANRLSDPRFRAFARAFNFGDLGARATSNMDVNVKIADTYIDTGFERAVGRDNPGAQLALYFQRKAPGITNNLQILADRPLAEFARTAFNLPASSGSSIDADLAALNKVLDVKHLRDPAKVDKMILRFTAMWDAKNQSPGASGSTSAALSLLSPVGVSPSNALLGRVQSLYSRA